MFEERIKIIDDRIIMDIEHKQEQIIKDYDYDHKLKESLVEVKYEDIKKKKDEHRRRDKKKSTNKPFKKSNFGAIELEGYKIK